MKKTTAAIAAAWCASGWTAYAAQPLDKVMQQIPIAQATANGGISTPGLLGNYPGSRDASGTSWQPDSTAQEGGLKFHARDDETVNAEPADQSSVSRSDALWMTRTVFGAGTLGLHSTVSLNPFLSSAAYYATRPGLAELGPSAWPDNNHIPPGGLAASYNLPLGVASSVFGYFGTPGEPALGPPVSYMRRLFGIDTPNASGASHWLDTTVGSPRVLTVGYTWRRFKVEGSAFALRDQDSQKQSERDLSRLDSKSTRLSYNPGANWSLQLSRGKLSGLDQLEPNEDVQRTTLSATYNRVLGSGNWQTTLAWGRNVRKSREPVMGYLLESTLHFSETHAVFGRLEQVGSGELLRDDESAQRQMFKLNRFTVGYFHNMKTPGALAYDVGAFASRYFVPSSAASIYGNEPTSLMLFVRLKFR